MSASADVSAVVGAVYMVVGGVGFVCNAATVLMIVTNRVYRLSAYTLMANVAFADSIMMLVAGISCGSVIFLSSETTVGELSPTPSDLNGSTFSQVSPYAPLMFALSFFEIAAWTAGVASYALLGLNRCIAICFYGTKAKALNRVSFALFGSAITWLIGVAAAFVGTVPEPLIGIRLDMWTLSFLRINGQRPVLFIVVALVINVLAVIAQWTCSTLVLYKIHQVKQKISKNKLNQNSANRFRKQARLTFQFFYPSLLCTVSSVVYFAKPFMADLLTQWQFVVLHLIWLCNHMCNPFIYAYFNDRMRMTYGEMISCASLRFLIRKKRMGARSFARNDRHNVSRRSNGAGVKSTRMSARSVKTGENRNFVRSSLQMQSRDFEQLCEFIMRVNPLYDSSEGWQEDSDEDEPLPQVTIEVAGASSAGEEPRESSRSIVMDLGRQTVEHWARFAKKASI